MYVKNLISQRVRTRRREAKISQSELAKRSGVSLGSIKCFERKNYQSINEILNAK